MYVVSTTPDGSVLDVFDPDVYLDEGVAVFPITDAEFEMLRKSGNNDRWMLAGGKIAPKPESELVELAAQARAERDQLLAATDWTQVADVPQATKDKFAPYRQALRDVPAQSGFPAEIVWPVKPA